MTWLDSKTLGRMLRESEELESGLDVAVLAARPERRSLRDVIVAHEHRQRRLRSIAIVANAISATAIGATVARAEPPGVLLAVAGALFALGLAASLVAAASSRAFERRMKDLPVLRGGRRAPV